MTTTSHSGLIFRWWFKELYNFPPSENSDDNISREDLVVTIYPTHDDWMKKLWQMVFPWRESFLVGLQRWTPSRLLSSLIHSYEWLIVSLHSTLYQWMDYLKTLKLLGFCRFPYCDPASGNTRCWQSSRRNFLNCFATYKSWDPRFHQVIWVIAARAFIYVTQCSHANTRQSHPGDFGFPCRFPGAINFI